MPLSCRRTRFLLSIFSPQSHQTVLKLIYYKHITGTGYEREAEIFYMGGIYVFSLNAVARLDPGTGLTLSSTTIQVGAARVA